MRYLALLLLALALFAGACGDDDDSNGDDGSNDDSEPTAAATQPSEDGEGPTTEPTEGADSEGGGGDSSAVSDLLGGGLSPFTLLNNVGSAPPASGAADPALQAALLTQGDLGGDYMGFGEFSFTVPTEYGNIDMVANMFAKGDALTSEMPGAMVMSAAFSVPPEAQEEFDALEDASITDAELSDLANLAAASGGLGIGLQDVRVLDASGLGDGGFGMHMAMDFSGLLDAFGGAPGEVPFDSMSIDMFIFADGDQMLMVMVMAPGDDSGDVDARDLAEAMDARNG
jgi:hypothetical protein